MNLNMPRVFTEQLTGMMLIMHHERRVEGRSTGLVQMKEAKRSDLFIYFDWDDVNESKYARKIHNAVDWDDVDYAYMNERRSTGQIENQKIIISQRHRLG